MHRKVLDDKMKTVNFFTLYFLLFFVTIHVEGKKLQRESSFPYLSGDTLRFFADWRLLTDETFQPEEVQLGDTVFVEHNYLSLFESAYLPQIAFPIVLITPYCEYDSDIPLPGIYQTLTQQEKIGCWFVIHIDQSPTEKIQPIPIGICNKIHPHGNTELFEHFAKHAKETEKNIHVFVNFRLHSNLKERLSCWEYFKQQPFTTSWFIPAEENNRQEPFWHDMSRSQFVVSPPGAGVDTFRTWESLLMGCYPIVKSSFLNPLYEELPVVIVNNWTDVTQELLNAKFNEFQNKQFNWDKLYAPYWFNKIQETQKKIRKNYSDKF